jgi:hypothetical protein
MWRTLLCLGVGLVLALGTTQAQEKIVGKDVVYLQGQVVKVNPGGDTIVVRTGLGEKAKDIEYKVIKTTNYYGPDRKVLTTGLRYEGFKEGANIWYRTGTGLDERTMTDIHFANPTIPPEKK